MSPWQSFWAHFSSALLLKEQMIISVKKVKNACQIWSLVKFAHIPSKSTIFYWLLFGEVCPENSCKIGQFLHELVSENPAKFHFFPRPIRSPDYFITFQTSPNPLSFYFRKKEKNTNTNALNVSRSENKFNNACWYRFLGFEMSRFMAE